MELQEGKERIGLLGTTFTIVGFVIGISIFVLPGELAGIAGPAVFVGFAIAAIPAFLSCFIAAQAANIFPTSGCSYIGASTVLSPFWGFMVVWNILVAMIVGMPALAYGFADYLAFFVPWAHEQRTAVAVVSVLLFGLINLLGVKTTVGAQTAMLVVFLGVIVVFGFGGLFFMDFSRLDPLFPPELFGGEKGWSALFQTAVAASFTFAGFSVITEMGDEIENPRRTIPLALFASAAIVGVLYMLVTFVLPGLIPWRDLPLTNAPIAAAATTFLPDWFGGLVALSAILGAATSVNAWFLTQSRDIYALARDRVLPKPLAHVNARFEEPDGAIVFCTLAVLGGVLLGESISAYAMMAALAIFVLYAVIGVWVLLAPRRVPEHFARARFKLSPPVLWAVGIAFILTSLFLLYVGVSTSPESARTYLLLLVPGAAYYFARKIYLERRGESISDLLKKDVSHLLS